ncbi:MAG: UDP-N-acetylmuramate--L-alanine ligase [Defluviitaleaceae bacterium]|nr:UDP-N-acetylmuramate--L-alanine ligase [Defluviitaleaceae bacterium]
MKKTKKINLNAKNIYFIGIGGVSMSGLAHILNSMGYIVSGSDRDKSPQTQVLEKKGIKINYNHSKENITDDIDIVVYTAAIKDDNPEYQAATQKNIKIWTRAMLLGKLIEEYQYSVCVAGTHGKTTTTSMIGYLLRNLTPTISVGAMVDYIGGNFKLGDSEYFVVESCEYNDSFLEFSPYIGVILNLEYDHPDHFKDLAQLEESFKTFANNTRGFLVINKNIKNYKEIVADTSAKVLTFGNQKTADIMYSKFVQKSKGKKAISDFMLTINYQRRKISVPLIGKHNIENAVAALAVCDILKVTLPIQPFYGYKNPHRRLEYKGVTKNGTIIIDDYAHHPTEIKSTLQTLRKTYPQKEIICLFQPHTYSRTIGLLKDFSTCFVDADKVLLLDIYAAREKDAGEIHSKDLQKSIKTPKALYFESESSVLEFLQNNLTNKNLLITMGATNLYLIGEALLGG